MGELKLAIICRENHTQQTSVRSVDEKTFKTTKDVKQKRARLLPRMWVLIQEPKGGMLSCLSLDSTENHCLAGGTIKSYECGLARWALPPGSRLIVGREGADIEVCSFERASSMSLPLPIPRSDFILLISSSFPLISSSSS